MYIQINITSYRMGPWAGRLPLRLKTVAVMDATQQNENKYNVATDHQTKQNKTKHHTQHAGVCVWVAYARKNASLLRMYVYQSISLAIYLSICLSVRLSVCLSVCLPWLARISYLFWLVYYFASRNDLAQVYVSIAHAMFWLNYQGTWVPDINQFDWPKWFNLHT